MYNKEYININISHMYYFLEVVECGSLTNAAQHLHTTQSNLSKCIAAIEQTLEVQLFVRSKKKLYLTEAGQYLYNSWKQALHVIEQSVTECKILSGGNLSSLAIGILGTHKPDEFLIPAIREYARKYPQVQVIVEAYPEQEIRKKLINGSLDVAFTVLHDIVQLGAEHFDYQVILSCPHSVFMLKDCDLAVYDEIEVAQLKEYEFISISPLHTPGYHNMLLDLCRQHGFEPNVKRYTTSGTSLTYNLKSVKDIFLCDEFYRDSRNNEICRKPLRDTESGVVAVWRNDNAKPELYNFISIIECNRD